MTDKTYTATITETQEGRLHFYQIRAENSEWARVVIDPTSGLFMCYGGTGNYNFSWAAPGHDFFDFLQDLNFDYAMSKFLGRSTHLNVKLSVQSIKQYIKDYRRDDTLTAELARKMWKQANTLALCSKEDFLRELEDSLFRKHYSQWYDLPYYDHGAQAKWFWQLIWKPLMLHIKQTQLAHV